MLEQHRARVRHLRLVRPGAREVARLTSNQARGSSDNEAYRAQSYELIHTRQPASHRRLPMQYWLFAVIYVLVSFFDSVED